MSSVYINDFDQPTYQYKYLGPINLGHVNIETLLTGFEPAYSQFVLLLSAVGALILAFAGTTPPSNAPAVDIVVEEMEKIKLCIGPMLGTLINPGTGAAVTVDASAASAAQDQSQGFFLVPGLTWTAYAIGGATGPMAIGHWYDRAGSYQPRFIVYLACVAFAAVAMSLLLRRGREQNSHGPGIMTPAVAIPLED